MGNVYLNGRFINQPITGVERYGREVMRRLPQTINICIPPPGVQGVRGHLWEQLSLPRQIGKHGILLSLANTGPLFIKNQVLTIHDVSVLDHPEWFQPRFAHWYRFLLPKLAHRSRWVVTTSEFSKSRIVSQCKIPPEKIIPIPCGVNLDLFNGSAKGSRMGEMVQNKYGLDGKYILSVSTIEPRKNFPVLFRAWQKIKKPFAPMVLVIVGGGKPHFRKVFPENDEDVIFLGRVPDEHLPSLYAGASAFIYPSVYEGFGLPILEAMACGVPVIASNCTAIPEVVGPAGILVDPVDADGLAEAIKKLLSDRTLRDQMAMLGKRRAASYSWKATADRIWDVLSNLFCFEA